MTLEPLLADSQAKLRAALELVFASAVRYAPFTPSRIYSPQEREPYDALSKPWTKLVLVMLQDRSSRQGRPNGCGAICD